MPHQGSWFGGLSWIAYSSCFTRLAAILAKRADGRPVKLLYDESGYYCLGDEAGTYQCKVGAKKDGTITAFHWHMIGIRNPALEKTYDSTRIPNIRNPPASFRKQHLLSLSARRLLRNSLHYDSAGSGRQGDKAEDSPKRRAAPAGSSGTASILSRQESRRSRDQEQHDFRESKFRKQKNGP